MKATVTSELRKTLKSLRIPIKGNVYSDTRKPGGVKAVGVKFCKMKISDTNKEKIIEKMKNKGFDCHYIKYNNNSQDFLSPYYSGTRFCFSRK